MEMGKVGSKNFQKSVYSRRWPQLLVLYLFLQIYMYIYKLLYIIYTHIYMSMDNMSNIICRVSVIYYICLTKMGSLFTLFFFFFFYFKQLLYILHMNLTHPL